MELRISPMTQTPALTRLLAANRETPGRSVSDTGFASTLKGALNSVSDTQDQAQALQREVQMENPNVSIEETMVAMQKAQLGFQATLHVRNRMVQAYTDIMNMQV